MLILMILALYRGWNEKLGRYVEDVDADVWVLQAGAADMFHSTSIFPLALVDELKTIDGVERADPLIGRRVPVENTGHEAMTIIMGYNTETGAGGPMEIVKGQTPKKGEIIIDEGLAKKIERGIGDTMTIVDREFNVSGISRGGNVVTFQYSFMPIEDARIYANGRLDHYALVTFSKAQMPIVSPRKSKQNFPTLAF